MIRKMSEIALKTPGIVDSVAFPGLSINGFVNSPNSAVVFTMLDPFEQRRDASLAAGAIAGQLNAVAPRFFRFTLTEGQQITAEVFARRLSSELDPVLRLLGPDGRELVYSDDVPGTEGDALLQWQAAYFS